MANPAVEVNARFGPLLVMGLCVFLFVCTLKKEQEGGREREREANFMVADGKKRAASYKAELKGKLKVRNCLGFFFFPFFQHQAPFPPQP